MYRFCSNKTLHFMKQFEIQIHLFQQFSIKAYYIFDGKPPRCKGPELQKDLCAFRPRELEEPDMRDPRASNTQVSAVGGEVLGHGGTTAPRHLGVVEIPVENSAPTVGVMVVVHPSHHRDPNVIRIANEHREVPRSPGFQAFEPWGFPRLPNPPVGLRFRHVIAIDQPQAFYHWPY